MDQNTTDATFIRTDASHADFRDLVNALDEDLATRDGEEHAFYHTYNHLNDIRHVVLALVDGQAVACGAFKSFDPETVEVKRMYTLPEFRGRGLASAVLRELEAWVRESGVPRIILETGRRQPEAIRLYSRQGYVLTANYGPYAGVENSVCFEKRIGPVHA